MSAGDEQCQERKLGGRSLQERCKEVSLQVVNCYGRNAPGIGQAPSQGRAGQQRPGQSGTRGIGDSINVGRLARGLLESFLQERQQLAHVVTGRKLRYHTAVRIVQLGLTEKPVREQALPVVQYGDRRFVTGGFDTQHSHGQFCLLNHTPLESRPFAGALANLSDSS